MSDLRVRRLPNGALSVTGITRLLAAVLRELPELLGSDQPEAVRRRLYPDPSEDEEIAVEWRRAQHPELFALMADSKRIVEHDLASLRAGRGAVTMRLRIPQANVRAWISALNAARLALGAIHEITAADMAERSALAFEDARDVAILRIDLYAWLQGKLIHAVPPS